MINKWFTQFKYLLKYHYKNRYQYKCNNIWYTGKLKICNWCGNKCKTRKLSLIIILYRALRYAHYRIHKII